MSANTEKRADDLEFELNRLVELTDKLRADSSILTRDLQEEIIGLLISTKASKDSLKVSEIRDEAVRVLTKISS